MMNDREEKITIFTFGSNLSGIHGAGSARHAYEHYDAEYGVGVGPTGMAYAIPTKDSNIEILPLETINLYVQQFLDYAAIFEKHYPNVVFKVVAVGCGLAGYKPEEIAPMFYGSGKNINLPQEFLDVLVKLEQELEGEEK